MKAFETVGVMGGKKKEGSMRAYSWVLWLCLSVWVVMYPRPYAVLITLLALLPMLALVLCKCRPERFVIDESRATSQCTDLSGMLVMPGFLLALRALMDVQLLNEWQLIWPTLILHGLLLLVVLWVAPYCRLHLGRFLLLGVLLAAYLPSLLALANRLFDTAPAIRQVVTVSAKRHTTGKGATQYFALAPPVSAGVGEARVARELYDQTQIGQPVCLTRHPGGLGMVWYTVTSADCCRK